MARNRRGFNHKERKYRRLSRGYFWAFTVAASLLVVQTMERSADKQEYRQTLTMMEAAIYAGSYALRSEQRRAGQFEAAMMNREGDLKDNVGYSDNLRRQLQECRSTVEMLSSDSWTGNAEVKVTN